MIEIRKAATIGDCEPLTWEYYETDDSKPQLQIILTDSHGHSGNLRAHNIAADGTVTPSCLFQLCGWHQFVKLLGWDRGEYKP